MSFRTTRWSVVLAAGSESRRALQELCTDYWYPLYAVARRRNDAPTSEDLVQGFFVHLLEKDVLAAVDPQRGRFRSFLRSCFENYVRNEWARATAQKRGGGVSFTGAEDRYACEPAGVDPFDRAWAHTLLRSTLAGIREEYAARDKETLFDALKGTLTGAGDSLAAIAEGLDTTEGAIKVAAHRLRTRYREAIRAAISETVTDPSEVEEEIGELFRAL